MMRQFMIKAGIASLLSLPIGATAADPMTSGKSLLELCTVADTGWRAMCSAYIAGVASGATSQALLLGRSPFFCAPANLSNQEFTVATVKYLRDHPTKLHLDATPLIFAALREAFPCPELGT
jgi:hypothetical protein